MTISSRPQAGNKNPVFGNPAFIDAGPWSRDQWAQKLIIEWVGDYVTTRGPFAKYLNRLAVTNPAGVTIQVDTGAGYCGGSMMDVTAAVTFTPNTPGIASRTDKVVMVENNTNAAYDGALSGVILDFPTDLTDYSGVASVPPYACRPAILRGDAVTGAATALIQSANYWMIELARFNITNVPAVNTLTDNRDYVDAETKYLWVQPEYGYNTTDGTDVTPLLHAPSYSAYELIDTKLAGCYAHFIVPADFIEGMTAYAVFLGVAGAPNIYLNHAYLSAACGETPAGVSTLAAYTMANGASIYNCLAPLAFAATVEGDDMVSILATRDATNVLDTVDASTYFIGWRIEYFGWR